MSRIKECIVPLHSSSVIMEVDYKQLEVVVLAFLSGDTNLISNLNNGLDMHSKSATFLCDKTYDCVRKLYLDGDPEITDLRKLAKGLTFLVQFGGSAKTLAKNTNVDIDLAQDFIQNYYTEYQGVSRWQDEVTSEIVDTAISITLKGTSTIVGSYTNPFGNHFYFKKHQVDWTNGFYFKPTEHKNYPIQGTAADIVKTALAILVPTLFKSYGSDVRVINTIHDSFILEVPRNILEEVALMVEYLTTSATIELLEDNFNVKFPSKLQVDIEVGDNWNHLEDIEKYTRQHDTLMV